jgi:hypothetical protein
MKKIVQLIFLLVIAYSVPAQMQYTYINVKDYGAKANGEIDDTESIQNALTAAAKNGGICFLPEGIYRLNAELVVPEGVTLKGVSEVTPHPSTPTGTILNIYGGKGNINADPAIKLKWNASIKNVIINYPEQRLPDIIPYPWTIQIDGQMCQVIDVTMTNPYMAIDAGTKSNELHFIRNVYACPLKIGIYVDRCTDVGRLENVHFNPNFWKRSKLESILPEIPEGYNGGSEAYLNNILLNYLQKNLVGFKIGRTDWEYITNCFVIFAKEGFLFDDFGHGMANAMITQSGSDIGPVAVQVNKAQKHAGLQFINCQFMSTIKIGYENEGPVKISNSGFWIIDKTLEQLVNEGTGTVILNTCHFNDWDIPNSGAPCLRASNGRLIVSNCEFRRSWTGSVYAKKRAILLEKDFISGIITANLFHNDSIENRSQGAVVISANVFEDYSDKIAITYVQLKDFCLQFDLNLDNIIALLNKNGIQAKADTTIGEITQKGNISPIDLYKMVRGN